MKSQLFFATATALVLATALYGQSSQTIIKINQCGYYTNAPKIACIFIDNLFTFTEYNSIDTPQSAYL